MALFKCKEDFTSKSDAEIFRLISLLPLNPAYSLVCGKKLKEEYRKRTVAQEVLLPSGLVDKIHSLESNGLQRSGSILPRKPMMTAGDFQLLKLILNQKKKEDTRIERLRTQCSCT